MAINIEQNNGHHHFLNGYQHGSWWIADPVSMQLNHSLWRDASLGIALSTNAFVSFQDGSRVLSGPRRFERTVYRKAVICPFKKPIRFRRKDYFHVLPNSASSQYVVLRKLSREPCD